MMTTTETLILLDSPDEGYCEEFGWVTTDVSEEDARFLLKEFCVDVDGDPPHVPQGPAQKVFLAPIEKSEPDWPEEWRWFVVEEDHPEALEFWQIDVTE